MTQRTRPLKTVANGLIATIIGVPTMSATTRIQVNEHDGIKVVRFQDHQLFDERTVREIADQIAEALPNDGSPIRLVVDFSEVSLISSTFLSKLILLQRRIDGPAASCGSAK